MKQTFSPCDECSYSFSKNNQESSMCKICEFKNYINAEKQGLLLRLPCKVGDTVYTACSWGIESGVVGSIEIISDRIFVNNIHGEMIGESHNIFLTQAEAEQKFKEMED